MFKNAFISEFSFSPDESIDSVLKSHLLSNEKIVIPAATVSKTELAEIIFENLEVLDDGAISIAHGDDRKNLQGYIEKYPKIEWEPQTIDLFTHFDNQDLCSIYDRKHTISQFNLLMRNCALGNINQFRNFFTHKSFCKMILEEETLFDLNRYFQMIDLNIKDTNQSNILKAHARYYYNFYGSFSTESGNTFSLENTDGFNYISSGSSVTSDKLSGLNILISSALDFTDGIEEFSYISNLDSNFLNKLTYKDILEIRQNWLHSEIVNKYEGIVQECAFSYLKMKEGHSEDALMHIEKAFEIRESILKEVNVSVKSEIFAYKIHRASKALSDAAISSMSFFSGLNSIKTIVQGIYSATTEIAVLMNKETKLKKLVNKKINKVEKASLKASIETGEKSLVTEYLKSIEQKIKS